MNKLSVFALPLLLLIPTGSLLAEETINAGLIPAIWYSETTIYAGDEIKIYGGMQNHSTSTVSVQGAFIVDGEPVSTVKLVSKPDTLIELEGKWLATSGNHKISLRITSAEPDNLLSKASEEVSLSVKTKITPEKMMKTVGETAENIISTIDNMAETLSNKVLALKKPVILDSLTQDKVVDTKIVSNQEEAPEEPSGVPESTESTDRSAYNLALTFLAASVLHWKVSLAAILLLLTIMKFTS